MCTSYRILFLTAVVAAAVPSSSSPAQPKDSAVAGPKQTGAALLDDVRPNTNTNPFKHRHWRHRGGKHPHYGSRRIGA